MSIFPFFSLEKTLKIDKIDMSIFTALTVENTPKNRHNRHADLPVQNPPATSRPGIPGLEKGSDIERNGSPL